MKTDLPENEASTVRLKNKSKAWNITTPCKGNTNSYCSHQKGYTKLLHDTQRFLRLYKNEFTNLSYLLWFTNVFMNMLCASLHILQILGSKSFPPRGCAQLPQPMCGPVLPLGSGLACDILSLS